MVPTIEAVIFQLVKIFFILVVVGFIVNFFKTYISQQKIKELLFDREGFKGNVHASILGAISPYSYKSSTKLLMNFLESGIPLGVSISFFISSAIINEYVAMLMLMFFGWKITAIYLISGIFVGIISGMIFSKRGYDKYISKRIKKTDIELTKKYSFIQRAKIGYEESKKIFKKMFLFVTIGFTIYMLIQSQLPESTVGDIMEFLGPFSVLVGIFLGIPFKGDGYAMVPIAVGLFEKGLPIGSSLAFVMAFIVISFSTGKKLRQFMDKKLVHILFLIIVLSIAAIGYLLNFLAYVT